MTDWSELVKRALTELGGRQYYVPGARLRPQVDLLAPSLGESLGVYLANRNLTFSQFVQQIPGILVHRRPGTDILVGFEGAVFPAIRSRRGDRNRPSGLRKDVYLALTRVNESPYAYVLGRDEFMLAGNVSEGEQSVLLEAVTLDELIRQRREFASELSSEDEKGQLLSALTGSANPIGAFHKTLISLGLSHRWHQFQMEVLTARLQDWASANELEPQPSWFQQAVEPSLTPQEALAVFSRYLSDDEVRTLSIPFRAVEEMYRSLDRRRF